MELEKYIRQKKPLSEEGFLKVMWGGFSEERTGFRRPSPDLAWWCFRITPSTCY